MPLYEYQCETCSHRFKVIQKFSDAPVATCQRCGGSVRKLLSSPAIQFKGSGWYITDYARAGKSESTAGGEASSAKSETSASTDAKSDSKAESKSESAPATKASTTE